MQVEMNLMTQFNGAQRINLEKYNEIDLFKYSFVYN